MPARQLATSGCTLLTGHSEDVTVAYATDARSTPGYLPCERFGCNFPRSNLLSRSTPLRDDRLQY
jgi:hypothetical protein